MSTLTIKSPKALNFCAPSPVKNRKLEMLPSGEISALITYDDGTTLSFTTSHGSVHIAANKTISLESDIEQANIKVAKRPIEKRKKKRMA
jgi:hypothetical protein